MEEKIHQLEQDIIKFKTSQGIGSSSSRIVPAGKINISGTTSTASLYAVIKFTTETVNPIITPRLTVKVNGQVITHDSQNAWIDFFYDDYWAAILIDDWTSEGFILPDEHTATVTIGVNLNQASANISIEGILYASTYGDIKVYTNL